MTEQSLKEAAIFLGVLLIFTSFFIICYGIALAPKWVKITAVGLIMMWLGDMMLQDAKND